MKNILIVGAGFSGAVVAERISHWSKRQCQITVIDERSHIGGNCYTERDASTSVMVHKYGPHIFNTNNLEVWNYVKQFCEMMPYVNRVKTLYQKNIYSFPINLHTINQFFGKTLNPLEAQSFIESLSDTTIHEPKNFEEQALKFIGHDLYHAFLYGYTKKQWGCEPIELPASVLKRLPVRFNYNDNYYSTSLQGIPKDGYTAIFEKLLDQPNIEVRLNTKFTQDFEHGRFEHVFYTGPIDDFFNYKFGRLGYRTVYFQKNETQGDYQGNAVINYADAEIPYTRIHEHKHFAPWETHEKTVYFQEYSKETTVNDIPYYPKRLASDMEKLVKYQEEARKLTNHTFLGRLATYRYMDMDHVIGEAMNTAENFNNKILSTWKFQ